MSTDYDRRVLSVIPKEFFLTALCLDMGELSSSRCFGFYPDEDEARDAVTENRGNMQESLYTHLVIETLTPGIHPDAREVAWYRWEEPEGEPGRWVESHRPGVLEHHSGFALG